jgi:hypothetical protein
MSVVTLPDGGLITKDPGDIKTYTWDWDIYNLAAAATIATSVWAITGSDALLTQDQATILSGARKTQVRLSGGTLGTTYTLTNTITTSESPSQTKERSVKVLVENK